MTNQQPLPQRAQLLCRLKRDREFLNQLIASLEKCQQQRVPTNCLPLVLPKSSEPELCRSQLDGGGTTAKVLPWRASGRRVDD